jgi:hypothetical protein
MSDRWTRFARALQVHAPIISIAIQLSKMAARHFDRDFACAGVGMAAPFAHRWASAVRG